MRHKLTRWMLASALLIALLAGVMVNAQEAQRGYLGIRLDTTEAGAIVVREVFAGSAAETAGIAVGDVITAVNGEDVGTVEDVVSRIAGLSLGDGVTLTIERAGDPVTIEVTLGEAPSGMNVTPRDMRPDRPGRNMPDNMPELRLMPNAMLQGETLELLRWFYSTGRLGVTFLTLDEANAAENNVAVTDGALITAVDADGPAAEAGVQAGDVVTAVNGEPVDAERTLRDRIIAYEPGDVVALTIVRGDETLTIEVTLGERTGGEVQLFDASQLPFRRDGEGRFFFEIPVPPVVPPMLTPESTPEMQATPNA
jgi:predicted metalloprotease with PDZ domain